MIPALTCLLLPFVGQCSDFVREVPTISAVVQHRAQYSGKNLSITGRVYRLDQWNSPAGEPEQLFELCDHGCVRVYMRGRSAIQNGQLVTVRGAYYAAFRAGRHTYHNEIEGTEVLPRE
jgi:hypothetical protein